MGDSTVTTGNLGDGNVIELTGKIMVVAIILLLFVVVFVFALHLYAKWFWYRRQETSSADDDATTRRRRRRLDFTSSHQEITIVASLSGGLDPTILETLPVLTFDPKLSKDGFECAVCLCEVSEGEKTRLLPKCNHGFHLDCIDMWFQSHSTCPLCRNPVANRKELNPSDELHLSSMIQIPIGENPSFPTNILFWGDESRVSAFSPCLEDENQNSAISEQPPPSSSASMVSTSNTPDAVSVIDIQRLVNEIDEEARKSLMPTRIRSLKRLLSGNRRVNNNPCSSRNLDLELGGRSGQS